MSDTSHSKLSFSTSITSQENYSTDLPTVQSDEFSNPLLRILLPSYASVCVKSTKTSQHTVKMKNFYTKVWKEDLDTHLRDFHAR